MAYTSNVPPLQFTPNGVVLPQEPAILAGVQSDMNAAFGGGLNPQLTSPQGQLASSQSAIIAEKNSEIAYIVNQIDPQYASGNFQDAIGRIYFLTRKPATATVVTCQIVGATGTVIPAGTLAQDTAGNTYASTGTSTIDATGAISLQFQNTQTGAIPCAPNTLNIIIQSISGWDTINNPAAGILGQPVESRAAFEARRAASVALNASGTVQAIYSNVFNVSGVIDVYTIDNPTGAPVSVGSTGYTLAPNSVYIAVNGGANQDIANAIWAKKDIGCSMNGNTTVQVVDSNYSYPQPTYDIKFNRPTPTPVLFAVQVVNSTTLPANYVQLIQNAIIAHFTGADGQGMERIGATVFASRYYGAISQIQNISLLSVLLGTSAPTLNQVTMGIDQAPTISASNITVTAI